MGAMEPGPLVVDARTLTPDGATIDRLARLQLAARRLGRRVLLRDPSADLRNLIGFAGLEDVLRVEPRREAEEREEPLGAEEERQLPDPPA
jgi:hypothetical protein